MRLIEVPDHTLITQEIISKLDHLFFTAHPTTLKNHLVSIWMKYLKYEHDALPPDFEDRVVDMNVLLEFLIVAEKEFKDAQAISRRRGTMRFLNFVALRQE